LLSGGPIDETFQRGWALKIHSYGAAHIWRRRPNGIGASALCRPNKIEPLRLNNGQIGLLHAGGWDRCKVCERLDAKLAKLNGRQAA